MRKLMVACVALIALAGCGGEDPPTDRQVIDRWSTAVREADFDAANELFAPPVKVFNGGPPQDLRTRADVNRFNRGFPCGAELRSTQDEPDGYTLATFKLVRASRGRTCPGAAGAEAKVTFLIDAEGHIKEWVRVRIGPPPGSQQA